MKIQQIWRGLVSGFLATVILSIIMMVKKEVGFYPAFNPIDEIAKIMSLSIPVYGWYMHFAIGVTYGIVYACTQHFIPGEAWFKGLVFASMAWLLMMISFMPLSGMGFFAMNASTTIGMFSFMVHLIFGFFLGLIYQRLNKNT